MHIHFLLGNWILMYIYGCVYLVDIIESDRRKKGGGEIKKLTDATE